MTKYIVYEKALFGSYEMTTHHLRGFSAVRELCADCGAFSRGAWAGSWYAEKVTPAGRVAFVIIKDDPAQILKERV